MKLDWPHVTLLGLAMAFVLALVVFAFKNAALMPVAISAVGAVASLIGVAWRGGQLAGSAPSTGAAPDDPTRGQGINPRSKPS